MRWTPPTTQSASMCQSRCCVGMRRSPSMHNDTLIAVDIAKTVFEIAISHRPGRVDGTHRMPRARFLNFFVLHRPGHSGHGGMRIRSLLEPQHPAPRTHRAAPAASSRRPYVLRNKTDRTDAKGILEAYRNEDIRPVPSRPSSSRRSPHSIGSARPGWRNAPPGINTVCAAAPRARSLHHRRAREVVPAVWALIEDAESDVARCSSSLLRRAVPEICAISRASIWSSNSSPPSAEQSRDHASASPSPASA